MKKIILSVFALFLIANFSLSAQSTGIQFFEGTWSEAVQKAKDTNKPIMLDCYTSWCGPCKKMLKDIFPEKAVGDFYNENYINVKMDMEKGEGPQLAEKFDIAAYPTFLFFNSGGQLRHKVLGYTDAEHFVQWGEAGLDPMQQYYNLREVYDKGDHSPKVLKNLAIAEEGIGGLLVDISNYADQYLDKVSREELLNKDNMDFVLTTTYFKDSKGFNFLINNIGAFTKEFGEDRVFKALYNIASSDVEEAIENKDESAFFRIKRYYAGKAPTLVNKMDSKLSMDFYSGIGEWTKYARTAIPYVDMNYSNNWQALNQYAWTFYEQIDANPLLEKAAQWARRSMEIETNYYNADTYAALLYKMGKKKEATEAAENAIAIAEKEGMNSSETKELLDKIRAMD